MATSGWDNTGSNWNKPSIGKSKDSWGYAPHCHETHPVLALGGGEVLGASCSSPRDGFDIYLGFDRGMYVPTLRPWLPNQPVLASYYITDQQSPKSIKEFLPMIDWLAEQLSYGKRVHMGCIGGHGRTGLVLSALVHVITGEKSAIHWAREHHCKKAVESESQVKFLVKHFGIESAKVTPRYSSPVGAMAIGGGYPSRGYSVGRDGVVDFDPFDDPYDPGRALDEMGIDDMFPEGELPAPRPRAKKSGASCAGKVKAMKGSRSIW